jgi:GT2 family glycosyltransferase
MGNESQVSKVYAVIVTYNGSKYIDSCLDSLINSDTDIKIIVVDNASCDDTVYKLNNGYKSVILIQNKENMGFGQANNLGIRLALNNGADFVFLLNQDAKVRKNTISKILDIQKSNPDYGILSPIHLNSRGDRFEEYFSKFILPPYCSSNFLQDLYFEKAATVYETTFVNAAAWMISRNCLQTVGGFDPIFFHYEEDMNYSQRVLFHGFKIGFCPDSEIFHDKEPVNIESFLKETYYKRLIADFADITNKAAVSDLNKLILRLILKTPVYVFKFQFSKILENYRLLNFLSKNIKTIKESRNKNVTSGEHYL